MCGLGDIESAATTLSSWPEGLVKVKNRSQPSTERVMESFGTSKKSFGSFSETYSECSDCAVSELSTGVTFVV